MIYRFVLLLVALSFAAIGGCKKHPAPAPPKANASTKSAMLSAQDIAENNRGVGLMGRFDYAPAVDVFAKLVKAHPKNLDLKVNLAIATLNRQEGPDLAQAGKLLDQVLEVEPKHVRANYCLGIIKLFNKGSAEALKHFEVVADADPRDPYVAYFAGQCVNEDAEKALAAYQKAIELDPYLRSAYYGAFMAYQRLGKAEDGQPLLDAFQRLATNPQSRLAEFKYTRMGPKAMLLAINLERPQKLPLPKGTPFAEAAPLTIKPNDFIWPNSDGDRPASVTVCDIDGDGSRDLFIAGGSSADESRCIVLIRDGDAWRVDAEHPLATVTDVNTVLWGDFDNDGLVDAYLCRSGTNQLWRQIEQGKWQDVTEETQTADGEAETVDGAIVDADHDGDLDLFLVNANGPNELLSNNRDGTFRPLAAEHGIAGDGRPSRQVLFNDFDGDRDADIIVLHDQAAHEVYFNDRSWTWHVAKGWDDFRSAEILAAASADVDADGQVELYTLGPSGLECWKPDREGQWRATELLKLKPQDGGARPHLAIADVDGDGTQEAIVTSGSAWQAVRLQKPFDMVYRAEPKQPLVGLQSVVLSTAGQEVIGIAAQGPPVLWAAGKARHPFVTIELTGKEAPSEQMRSNRSGIGVRLAGRADSLWSAADTYRSSSGPGQSTPLVALGAGGHKSLDFVSLIWPDGLLQSELALATGKRHTIAEVQRQVSSCPVLFVWNGERYEFVTDLLGVGGLGFAIGDGTYVPPTPRENLLLPQDVLQPAGDVYRLKLLEPMEEACYVDGVRLVYYDLPPGWQMTLDERCSTGEPAATGEPQFYRRALLPVAATNDRDEDVSTFIHVADHSPAPPGIRDPQFIGRTARHSITLQFDQPLDELPGRPLLIADGWVEYPYSQTMFAAWQAGAKYESPTIEAQDGDGRWHAVLSEFGYPGGMRRQMSAPLPPLPTGCRSLRIRTNLEIYWDRLIVAFAEDCRQARRRELKLASARLDHAGFPKRTDGPLRQVDFDYSRRAPSADMRFQRGWYTEYGSVEPLLGRVDDAVAIFGPGEEISLEFEAPRDTAASGWTRQFVLESNGWCKDMDLYTQHGETVEPLPRRAMSTESSEDRDHLHKRFNTRYMSGE